MTAFRLWSDEIEGMRAEARAVIAEQLGALPDFRGDADDRLTIDERVAKQRATMAFAPVPEADERTIAGVRCRVFTPPGPATAVYLHFHGGGMILGAPEMMDIPNRDLSAGFGIAVVSVDYAKAPEHPYPAGPDDGCAVAAWLVEHAAQEFGTDRILIGGESAGGYMAAMVALFVRDQLQAVDRVIGLNLVFGVYDWSRSPSQRGMRPHDGPDLLDPDGIRFFVDCFLPGMTDDERSAPSVSPAAADLHGLPPTFLSVGTCDHLFDDTVLLAGRAAAAGVDVDLFVAPDMPHGFMMFPCAMTDAWITAFTTWLTQRLA